MLDVELESLLWVPEVPCGPVDFKTLSNYFIVWIKNNFMCKKCYSVMYSIVSITSLTVFMFKETLGPLGPDLSQYKC